jgi:hypothetical protein
MEPSTVPKPTSSLSLPELKAKTGLTRDRASTFFTRWLDQAEPLSDQEVQALARLQRNHENIVETNPLEEVVKLVCNYLLPCIFVLAVVRGFIPAVVWTGCC